MLTERQLKITTDLCKGNPGAIHGLAELFIEYPSHIDTLLLLLVQLGIRGSDIYILYNDIAEGDLSLMHYLVINTKDNHVFTHKLLTACKCQQRNQSRLIVEHELNKYYHRDMV
jgi:hypothetical protein